MELSVFSDEYYMKLALQEAEKAFVEKEIPIGAVIVAKNRIIAKAHNQVEKLQDVTAHAEMLAITAAQDYLGAKYLDQCTMFVTLEPCVMCGGATFWAQLGRIVIGARDEKRGFSRVQPMIIHPKTLIEYGLMEGECQFLIKEFFRQMRGNNS